MEKVLDLYRDPILVHVGHVFSSATIAAAYSLRIESEKCRTERLLFLIRHSFSVAGRKGTTGRKD